MNPWDIIVDLEQDRTCLRDDVERLTRELADAREQRYAALDEVLAANVEIGRLRAELAQANTVAQNLAHDRYQELSKLQPLENALLVQTMRGRIATLEAALRQCVEALRLTREYVGEEVLPAVRGWSWYDATINAQRALDGQDANDQPDTEGTTA